jgi:hypothetical protein
MVTNRLAQFGGTEGTTSTLGPITTNPINNLCFPHWCTGLALSAMKTACMHFQTEGLQRPEASQCPQPSSKYQQTR